MLAHSDAKCCVTASIARAGHSSAWARCERGDGKAPCSCSGCDGPSKGQHFLQMCEYSAASGTKSYKAYAE